jgi:hypothetical protein
MALIDIEKTISQQTSNPVEQKALREAACLGLKAAIEEVRRQMSYALSQNYKPAYIAAQKELLIFLEAMLSRAEQGLPTHSGSSVQ